MKNQKTLLLLSLMMMIFSSNQLLAYSGGSGTSGDPYQIATAADLVQLSSTQADWGKHFILTADIDMTGQTFYSIGYRASSGIIAFSGSIDGDLHVIKNLTVTPHADHANSIGLVGFLSGSIMDLGIVYITITPSMERVAAFAGFLDWGGSISNCFVDGGTISGTGRVAGIVGWLTNGTVSNCMVDNVAISAGWNRAGIAAHVGNGTTTPTVTNCVFYGSSSNGKAHTENLQSGTIVNGYYAENCGATDSNTGVSMIATANLATQGSYGGFDFTNTWMMTAEHAVLKFPYFIK